MNIYYYFLFRLYWSFRDFSKEGHKMALISTAIFSCVFLCFAFYAFILFSYYWTDSTIPSLDNNLIPLIFGVVIFIINYRLAVKNELFLKKSFEKGKLGGFPDSADLQSVPTKRRD